VVAEQEAESQELCAENNPPNSSANPRPAITPTMLLHSLELAPQKSTMLMGRPDLGHWVVSGQILGLSRLC
jgi:hypothetical protein